MLYFILIIVINVPLDLEFIMLILHVRNHWGMYILRTALVYLSLKYVKQLSFYSKFYIKSVQ